MHTCGPTEVTIQLIRISPSWLLWSRGSVASMVSEQGSRSGVRPIIIQGHSRPLTMVKYNREGDLLFTAAKDHRPCCWYADNGERIGTYDGHNGTVWCLDVNCALLAFEARRACSAALLASMLPQFASGDPVASSSIACVSPLPDLCSVSCLRSQ